MNIKPYGKYVYDIRDNHRKILLVFKITEHNALVYCLRRHKKFWIEKQWLKITGDK